MTDMLGVPVIAETDNLGTHTALELEIPDNARVVMQLYGDRIVVRIKDKKA